jgi:methionine-rich copper-binding protein CopC
MGAMLKITSRVVLALFAASLLANPVEAHPTLKSSIPPAESTAATPKEIRLSFSEGVIVKLSSVELKDRAGKKIATGKLATDPKDQKLLIVPLQDPLPAGTYSVTWKVVSVDTHRVNGTYSFKVEG